MNVQITSQAEITAEALYGFYVENGICEAAYGQEKATRVLLHPHIIVAAVSEKGLGGIARATFDGLAAAIMELSLALQLQDT